MRRIEWLLSAGAVGGLFCAMRKSAREKREAEQEDTRRRETVCLFVDGITAHDFEQIAVRASKEISRIKTVSVDGPIVYGTVRAVSGLSEWGFQIDFNDYGHVTGKYWIQTENKDSSVPQVLADNICAALEGRHDSSWFYDFREEHTSDSGYRSKNKGQALFCSRCGKKLTNRGANYCVYCGERIL